MKVLPHNADKATTAKWMGYPQGLAGIAAMDRDHDPLHERLCDWLGIPSTSMKIARGGAVTGAEQRLAGYEEDAVLYLQRFIQHARLAGAL